MMMQEVEVLKTISELVRSYFSEEQFTLSIDNLMFTAERRSYIISIKKEGIMDTEKAYLSNDKDMIQFRYGDKIIRFRGPYSLERFISIKEWDNYGLYPAVY